MKKLANVESFQIVQREINRSALHQCNYCKRFYFWYKFDPKHIKHFLKSNKLYMYYVSARIGGKIQYAHNISER